MAASGAVLAAFLLTAFLLTTVSAAADGSKRNSCNDKHLFHNFKILNF
jgi:hypothetical protein